MGTRKTAGAGNALDPAALLAALHTDNRAEPTASYRCTLVTPMYGGGVAPGVVDRDMPIRATAIRGQLRFWWRLLNRRAADGKALPAKALFDKERAIWGGLGDVDTLAKSQVRVAVRGVSAVSLKAAAVYPAGKSFPKWPEFDAVSYALFPAADINKEPGRPKQPAQLLSPGCAFDLHLWRGTLLNDAQWLSVLEALRWWGHFGGVGARTRRGLGALDVRTADGSAIPMPLDAEIARCGCQLRTGVAGQNARAAWELAITRLKTFRQGINFARNAGPGRSRWPEADAIRRLAETHFDDGTKNHKPTNEAGNVFPRAVFGMPIGTHFKDRGDPGDTELLPVPRGESEAAKRMASPLILRPIQVSKDCWVAGALLLPRDHMQGMGLELGGKGLRKKVRMPAGTWWQDDKAALIRPLAGLPSDPLEAFMAYFPSDKAPVAPKQTVAPKQAVASPEVLERPNLKRNPGNKSISVTPEGGKSITLSGNDAEACYAALSDPAKARLAQGKLFNRLQLTVAGTRFIELKEYTA